MTKALPKPPDDLDPEHLAFVGAAFMSAKLLGVAVDLGLFEQLADGPRTLDELVTATGLARRALRVVVSGLAATGILELSEGRFANGRHAQAFLAGRTSVDLRPGLRLYNHIIYPMWMGFEESVRTGQPAPPPQRSEAFGRIFSEGVDAWTGVGARALPDRYDFAPHRRILDLGGGTGSYLLPILDRHPEVRATLFDLPPSIAAAGRRLAQEPARDRIEMVEGDALFDPLPEGHDLVIMAGFIHLFNPDRIALILDRVRAVVPVGARLLIVDQWMDATHTSPVFGAMLAATYLLLAGDGDTYSVDEARPWLDAAGFRIVDQQRLSGVISVLVAEAQ